MRFDHLEEKNSPIILSHTQETIRTEPLGRKPTTAAHCNLHSTHPTYPVVENGEMRGEMGKRRKNAERATPSEEASERADNVLSVN